MKDGSYSKCMKYFLKLHKRKRKKSVSVLWKTFIDINKKYLITPNLIYNGGSSSVQREG